MTEPIVEVRLQVTSDSLQLEWGMPVTKDRKWQWPHQELEVRLFCDPFPNLGKPELLNTPIEHRESTYGYGLNFGLPFELKFLSFSANREFTQSRFEPGAVFASPDGKCYPVTLRLRHEDIPAEGVICYPLVKWPVETEDWLKSARLFWVQFGYTKDGRFNEVERETFRQEPNAPDKHVLPDISVPESERPRRRAATPKIFISYSRHNLYTVKPIARRLGDEFGFDVWIDYDSIPGGDNWKEAIAKGIQQADRVLFMMSAAACASEWCRAEVEHAVKHRVKVIPIQIATDAKPDDLGKVGLSGDINIRDMNKENAWDQLINLDLPQVMVRNKQLLDPAVRSKHLDYLRSLYKRLGYVSLVELYDRAPREQVRLMDVYVRLKLGISFNLEVKDGEYVDWWLREQKEERAQETEAEIDPTREMPKPKSINGFAPQGEGLKAWEVRMREAWAREKADVYKEDGTYGWKRIESEIAPALMPYVVITGNPGSGKSTLLKHLALCLADDMLIDEDQASLDTLEFWPHKPYTPVFIELRALIRTAFPNMDDQVTLAKILGYIDEEQLKPHDIHGYLVKGTEGEETPLRVQMRAGEVIFFLDGLDEVPDAAEAERRSQIKEIVRELRGAFPDCRMVITSRPHAYAGDWQIEDFGQVTLAPLDEDRLEELAQRLFRVVLGDGNADEQAEQFRQAVAKVEDKLRQTPLFFTLMAQIWLNNQHLLPEQRLPTLTRGAIFEKCVDMLISRWTRKDLSGSSVASRIGMDEVQLRALLANLAYRVHKQVGSRDDAVFEAGEVLNTIISMQLGRIDPYELNDALSQRAGVLFAPDAGKFQFAHRNIREYLAARYLATADDFPQNAVQIIREPGDRWRAVLDLLPDELSPERLWKLIEALLAKRDTPLPDTDDDPLWRCITYGTRWMHQYELPDDEDLRLILRKRNAPFIAAIIERGLLLVSDERAEMGRILSVFGDPRPGISIVDGVPEIAWSALIPAGEYPIGGDENALNSLPAEQYTLEYSFRISKYPITYGQFQAFLDATDGYGSADYDWFEGLAAEEPHCAMREQAFKYANHPRDNVNWYQAMAFARWLSWKETGEFLTLAEIDRWPVRLPTEREWEIAARGPEGLLYPYGNEFDRAKGNTSETGIRQTSAVGIFADGAAWCEALDMSGNVWEWCLNPVDVPDDGFAAENLRSNARRVLRGGSWFSTHHDARAAYRHNFIPGYRVNFFGFRLCCVRAPSL